MNAAVRIHSPLPFTPVLEPLAHQWEHLDNHARRAAWGLLHEQGCGKTKTLIDNNALLAIEDNLTGSFVLAPNGVHLNWHLYEIPKHWPKDAPAYESFVWDTAKAANKSFKTDWAQFLRSRSPFKWLLMSYDGIMTEGGKKASWDFLRSTRASYILDESQRAKTPDAARTKRVIASSVYAAYRRIASGTPMDTPFDIYSQVRFLDPEFWSRELGLGSFSVFKSYFGEWYPVTTNSGHTFDQLKRYRNLDRLEEALRKITSRVLKDDVLDLPPKTYKRAMFELGHEQRKVYEQLREEALALLDSDEVVTVKMALVLQMRLSQVTSGFVRPDGAPASQEPYRFKHNPREELCAEILSDLTRPAIVWTRFVEDTAAAARASKKAGRVPVIFDGTRPLEAIEPFRRGEAQDLIANLSSGMTEGWTLVEADTTVYFSNGPRLIPRLQSEDRNHRIGQDKPVEYVDLLAAGTADVKGLDRLLMKRDIVSDVLGDNHRMSRAERDELREMFE